MAVHRRRAGSDDMAGNGSHIDHVIMVATAVRADGAAVAAGLLTPDDRQPAAAGPPVGRSWSAGLSAAAGQPEADTSRSGARS